MFTDDETASPWDAALRFRDQAVECKFWASARPRLLRADRLLATAAVIGGNLSVFLAPGVSRAFYLSRVLFAATLTALQCAALACMRHDAAYYFHYRTCLVAAQRITRLAGLAFFGAMLSGWSVAADLPARSLAALQAAPTGWLAFAFLCNALAFGTSAAYHLAHSLAFPARFPLQLLFQTLALPVLAAHTGAAVKALREPLLEAAVCRVYGIMRRTILLPMDGQKCCTVGTCPPQAAVVLGWTVRAPAALCIFCAFLTCALCYPCMSACSSTAACAKATVACDC